MTLMDRRTNKPFYLLTNGRRYTKPSPDWSWIIGAALLGLLGGAALGLYLRSV